MLFIHGFSGQPPSTNNVQSMNSTNIDNDVKHDEDDDDDFDGSTCCGHCGRGEKKKKRKRGICCPTILFLLAVDAFTIALLLILFYNIKHLSGNYL